MLLVHAGVLQHCRKSFDLGQFERFRRIMHIPAYKPLLHHEQVEVLSTLQVSLHQALRSTSCCLAGHTSRFVNGEQNRGGGHAHMYHATA